MERELINIWDVVHTTSDITGIVITKRNHYVDLALEGNLQVVSFEEIDYKLGNIKNLINIFPISNLYSVLDPKKEEEEQIYFDYKKDSITEKFGNIPMEILLRRKILDAYIQNIPCETQNLFSGARNVTQKEYEEILKEMNNED